MKRVILIREDNVSRILSIARRSELIFNFLVPTSINSVKIAEMGYRDRIYDIRVISEKIVRIMLGFDSYVSLLEHSFDSGILGALRYLVRLVSMYAKEVKFHGRCVVVTYKKRQHKKAGRVLENAYLKFLEARPVDANIKEKLERIWYYSKSEKVLKVGTFGVYRNIVIDAEDTVLHFVSLLGDNDWCIIDTDIDSSCIDLILSLVLLRW